jgi:hypothetical protein
MVCHFWKKWYNVSNGCIKIILKKKGYKCITSIKDAPKLYAYMYSLLHVLTPVHKNRVRVSKPKQACIGGIYGVMANTAGQFIYMYVQKPNSK